MKKMLMVLMMVLTMGTAVFAESKSNEKASMEETRVERQEDFDTWFKAINAEVEARDAELKAAMEEIGQRNKEYRDAVRKAAEAKENK